jgi:multidrug transporter EmrE-like cation transporter
LTEAGYCLLGIFAMYEVVGTALLSMARAWRLRTIIIVLVVSVLLGFVRSQVHPLQYGSAYGHYVVLGEIAVRFVEVFVFAGIATLGPLIGLRLRRSSFGVAMGFGFYATVMLMATSRYADMGKSFAPVWRVLTVVAYSVAVLIWIWFFWAPAKSRDCESSALGPALG